MGRVSGRSVSIRDLKMEYPFIKKSLRQEKFWSPSYCLISAGGAPIEVIERYIDSQFEEELHG